MGNTNMELYREPYASPDIRELLDKPADAKPVSASYTIKASIVLPPDTNHHGTIFGGKLMAYIDDVATIAATRHARRPVVTASTDSVDFLHPVKKGDAVCLSAFVTWAHKTSMEIFVRVITEDLLTGERKVCATSFLTFVALGEDGKPTSVPGVIPETPEERMLHETAPMRKDARKIRRLESKKFAEILGVEYRLGGGAERGGMAPADGSGLASAVAAAPASDSASLAAAALDAAEAQRAETATSAPEETRPYAAASEPVEGSAQSQSNRGRSKSRDSAFEACWESEW